MLEDMAIMLTMFVLGLGGYYHGMNDRVLTPCFFTLIIFLINPLYDKESKVKVIAVCHLDFL